MVAVASLLVVLAVSLLIIRVATVILTATGMSRQSARFQARSAFTTAGFTTNESEQVVEHPLRRRVVSALMLLGNVGIVAAASTTILGLHGSTSGRGWWRILELVGGVLVLILISRSQAVDRRLTAAIGHVVRRYTDLPNRDVAGLLDLSGEYAVSELAVRPGDWTADRNLAELGLRDEGVVVLGLTRADGRYLGAPTGRTVVRPGDVLIVYGLGHQLRELDDRPAGSAGELAHEAAVARQEAAEREEQAADRAVGDVSRRAAPPAGPSTR